ncbi:MAG TPA: shewanella-like protein phosphatase [Polyangiaceae bacterium]|nr:shewanella-like protein phosphatase [Polyangiaceae bacterium]
MRCRMFLLALLSLGVVACDRTPETKPETKLAASWVGGSLSRGSAGSQPRLAPPPNAAAPKVQAEQQSASASNASFRVPSRARLVAIGDVHGDLNALREALKLAGAIDSDDRWIGRDLTVVQTGDQLDRGDQDREVLDVLEKLEGEAQKAASELIVLNGNHELMNAGFDFRYVTAKSFATFADFSSHAPALAERLPHEARGRAAAFAPGGPYALKLARHLTVAVVGDSLFAHGGVLPAHVDYGLSRINEQASAFLAGKLAALPPVLAAEDAPVWTRAYGEPELDASTCVVLERVLQQVGAVRMVVGHTVQKGGISAACQDKVFRIDVGLSAYYGDNPTQVLEIAGSKTRVLTAGAAPAKPKSAPRDSSLHSAP